MHIVIVIVIGEECERERAERRERDEMMRDERKDEGSRKR